MSGEKMETKSGEDIDLNTQFEAGPGEEVEISYSVQIPTKITRILVNSECSRYFVFTGIRCGVNSQMEGPDPVPAFVLSHQRINFEALSPGQIFAVRVKNVSGSPRKFLGKAETLIPKGW